jgi:hypothetical protein
MPVTGKPACAKGTVNTAGPQHWSNTRAPAGNRNNGDSATASAARFARSAENTTSANPDQSSSSSYHAIETASPTVESSSQRVIVGTIQSKVPACFQVFDDVVAQL